MAEEGGGAQPSVQAQLLEWSVRRGAFVHSALELKADGATGWGWVTNEDVPDGTTVISVPMSLCIPAPGCAGSSAGAAWPSSLRASSARRVCDHLVDVRPPLHQACTHAVLLAYLLSHHQRGAPSRPHIAKAGTVPNLFGLPLPAWLFDTEDSDRDVSTGEECDLPGCGFAPYLACLPRPNELSMLPAWPSASMDELSCTSLAPQAVRRKAALLEPDVGGEEMAAFLRSAMPEAGPEDTADGGAMTVASAQSCLEHATLLCKSRAFVVSGGGPGGPEEWRLLVPLVDMVNHSVEPRRICTRVRIAERALDQLEGTDWSRAPDDEASGSTLAVELVTTRDTAAGTSLCYSYGDFSSADCLQRFGFVDAVADAPEQPSARGCAGRADAIRLPPAEAASVPLDAVLAACRTTQPGGTRVQLDTLADQRLAQQAAAADLSMRNGRRATSLPCADSDVDVIRIGHPDDKHGLERLLGALRKHSGESLEQSIADRCYSAEAIRVVARDVIGWTIACHWQYTLEEELRQLHDAEVEMELDESLALAGADEISAAIAGETAPVLRRQRSSSVPIEVDALEVELPEFEAYATAGLGARSASWFRVQVARLRVRELAVLSRWHEALAARSCG